MERNPNRLDIPFKLFWRKGKKIPTWLKSPANFITISINCAKELKQV